MGNFKESKILSWICALGVLLFSLNADAQQASVRTINANLNAVAGGKSHVPFECIGAGRANEGLRADWQKQLAMVQKEIGFKYIRFHGLLHDDMRVYSENKNGEAVYNWQYVDHLFDYLLSINIRPFVEFGFMPRDLAAGTKTIFWWKANVSKPKSYEKWDSLITNLMLHWQERYGKTEVEKWYFEVWNEPDLKGFYDGTQADYFELYTHTAKAVKNVSAKYRVGGPATSGTKWITDFLSFCQSNQLPVDFVSTHDYGTTSVLDEMGTKKQQLKSGEDIIAKDVKRVRELINASAYKNAELHFTEWNSSPSSRDPIHDTYQNATFILNTLKKASVNSNSMSYWTFTDVFEEAGPGPSPFHGGFGLVNLQDIRKPSYFAYKFMAELGEDELQNTDGSSYVCKSKAGDQIQALVWDYTFPKNGYSYNQDYFGKIQPSPEMTKVRLHFSNVKRGRYRMEVYRVGYQENDPYTAYLEMGKPVNITKIQEEELKSKSSILPLSTKEIQIPTGDFDQQFGIKENEVLFVKLFRLK